MGLFDYFKKKEKETISQMVQPEPISSYRGGWKPIRTKLFDGEKTAGEMGNVINLLPDYQSLRLRAYEAELKSDAVKTITGRFFKWVVGSGLKLQAEPNEIVLKSEGINEDFTGFRTLVEARFSIYSSSKNSDYSGMLTLHQQANNAFKSAFLGGDCLAILRVENDEVKVQVIDGQEVISPLMNSEFYALAKEKGNTIVHGIEVDKKGTHVAFYVLKNKTNSYLYECERVEAKSAQTGRLMAWMIYGTKHRINHYRGIPQITAILEKVEKLDRYTEASVGAAEERANIVFAIEHSRDSTGENPIIGNIKKNIGGVIPDDPHTLGAALEKDIASTTSKQTFNLPVGARLKSLASSQENQYPAFQDAVFIQLCSATDIPPEVALQKYNSNYSASRAAINGWGYIVDIYRKNISDDFYRNVYNLWLEVQILKSKVKAPGYIRSIYENNYMAIESYSNCKFTGVNMPHIDPLKEIKYIREMLGDPANGKYPLISHDRASELLNQGEWSENYLKYMEENSLVEKYFPKETEEID